MDRAVVEDTPVLCCVAHEEACRVQKIGCLTADEERFANRAGVELRFCVAVGGVEAAGVAGHDFEVRVFLCEGADGAGLEGVC